MANLRESDEQSRKGIFLPAAAVLIDATVFAYAFMLAGTAIYLIQDKIIVHSSCHLEIPNESLILSMALAAIFWGVSFFSYLLPMPTVCVFLFNVLSYSIGGGSLGLGQNEMLDRWYFMSVPFALMIRIVVRRIRGFSIGAKLLGLPSFATVATNVDTRSTLVQKLAPYVMCSELAKLHTLFAAGSPSSSGNGITTPSDGANLSDRSGKSKLFMLVFGFAMLLGLFYSLLWRLPLKVAADQLQQRFFADINPNHYLRWSEAKNLIHWYLYSGDGSKALNICQIEAREATKTSTLFTKDQTDELMGLVDRVDRLGYCKADDWEVISKDMTTLFQSWLPDFKNKSDRHWILLLSKYLRDGNERHGMKSRADEIDQMRLKTVAEVLGPNKVECIDPVYDSGLFHARMHEFSKAREQFKTVLQIVELNGNTIDRADEQHYRNLVTKSQEMLNQMASK